MFEDGTRKYGPKARENIPYTLILFTSFYIFEQTTAYKTTSITFTGYRQ